MPLHCSGIWKIPTGFVNKDPIINTQIKELTDKATTIIGYTPSILSWCCGVWSMVANLEILSIGQMSLFHVADHIASLDVVSTSHSTCFVMKKVKHLLVNCMFAQQFWFGLFKIGLQSLSPQPDDLSFDE